VRLEQRSLAKGGSLDARSRLHHHEARYAPVVEESSAGMIGLIISLVFSGVCCLFWLVVIAVVVYFVFLRGGGDDEDAPAKQIDDGPADVPDPEGKEKEPASEPLEELEDAKTVVAAPAPAPEPEKPPARVSGATIIAFDDDDDLL